MNETQANELITLTSVLLERSQLAARLGDQFGGDREIYDVLGYDRTPTFEDYYAKYRRQDLAKRVIAAPAKATWRHAPGLQEDEDGEQDTPFEQAWSSLVERLNVFHYFERADRLAGIGRYGVILIGVRGNDDLSRPLEDGSLMDPEDIIYLSVFHEGSVDIHRLNSDPGSERFGQPETYEINLAGDLEGVSMALKTQMVHHSRVIHIAEELDENEVFGTPRLEAVLNRLEDIVKLVGGSAEMFWQGAYRGLHVDVRDDYNLGDDESDIEDQVEEYLHNLRRFLFTQGIDVNDLGGDVADPSNPFDVAVSLISAATNIPKRILLGSERGELASSQDESNWLSYVEGRQTDFAEPVILRPFVDRLILKGALPAPADGYEVEWPNLFALNDIEESEVLANLGRAARDLAASANFTPGEVIELFRVRGFEIPEVETAEGVNPRDDTGQLDEDDDQVQAQFNRLRRVAGGD